MSHYNLHSLDKAICSIQDEVGSEKNMRDVEKGKYEEHQKGKKLCGIIM
jgi:hypothetical protein